MRTDAAPPRHLLLATDLSARTDRAQDRAVGLAAEWGARLTVVHALDDAGAIGGAPPRPSLDVARTRAWRLLREQFGSDVDIVVAEGRPEDVVRDTARARGADLIITGIAGNEPLGQAILGSTTSTLARSAAVPVLVVKTRGDRPYRRVAVASDLSEGSAPALHLAVRLFGSHPITLMHVFDTPFRGFIGDKSAYERDLAAKADKDARAFATSRLGEDAARLSIAVMPGDVPAALADHAAQADIDLVIAGTRGHSGLLGILLGHVAGALLEQVPCDVMVVPGASQAAPG